MNMVLANQKSTAHLAKHIFLIGKVYRERNNAKQAIYEHLRNMRKSIIRMSLTYSDLDRLKAKIDNFIELEGKYARFFRHDDKETKGLKEQINALEEELKKEKESKLSMMADYDEKIKELTESLNSIKNSMRHLLMEKAKRQRRLKVLEQKIDEKTDRDSYFK